ncbi:hypothetical protein JTB14_029885 [Gonioctena quinquepunctata]|nr:hypothetical protein JTB14_029885 [Gonioctena quinquepunctata]
MRTFAEPVFWSLGPSCGGSATGAGVSSQLIRVLVAPKNRTPVVRLLLLTDSMSIHTISHLSPAPDSPLPGRHARLLPFQGIEDVPDNSSLQSLNLYGSIEIRLIPSQGLMLLSSLRSHFLVAAFSTVISSPGYESGCTST